MDVNDSVRTGEFHVDVLTFVSQAFWPGVVIGALFMFRGPIEAVLYGLRPKRVKGFGFDAEFESALTKVEELILPGSTASQGLPDAETAPSTKGSVQTDFSETLDSTLPSPESAKSLVWSSWGRLESMLALRAKVERPIPVDKLSDLARNVGLTDREVVALLELRRLRDRVAHLSDFEISRDEALRYNSGTLWLMTRIAGMADPEP